MEQQTLNPVQQAYYHYAYQAAQQQKSLLAQQQAWAINVWKCFKGHAGSTSAPPVNLLSHISMANLNLFHFISRESSNKHASFIESCALKKHASGESNGEFFVSKIMQT